MPKIVDHDQRREFIAQISAEIIAQQGLDQATIREIAQRTGFSKGVIEHYFDDKNHIIDAAVDWINQRFIQREQKATAGKQGLAALEARLECALPLTKESLREWKIRLRFWSDAAVRNDLHSVQGERLKRTRERFTKDIEEAKQLGELQQEIDSMHAANMLIHFVCGVSANALIVPNYYNRKYMKKLVQDVIGDMRYQRGNSLLLHGRGDSA